MTYPVGSRNNDNLESSVMDRIETFDVVFGVDGFPADLTKGADVPFDSA